MVEFRTNGSLRTRGAPGLEKVPVASLDAPREGHLPNGPSRPDFSPASSARIDELSWTWSGGTTREFARAVGRPDQIRNPLFPELACYPSLRALVEPHVVPGHSIVLVAISVSSRVEDGPLLLRSELSFSYGGARGRLAEVRTHGSDRSGRVTLEVTRRLLLGRPTVLPTRSRVADVVIAQAEPPMTLRVPDQARALFAEVTSDHNPLHSDDKAAATAGFDSTPVHGMYLLANAVSMASDALGWPVQEVDQIECRFGVPAYEGERTTLTAVRAEGRVAWFALRKEHGPVLRTVRIRRRSEDEGRVE